MPPVQTRPLPSSSPRNSPIPAYIRPKSAGPAGSVLPPHVRTPSAASPSFTHAPTATHAPAPAPYMVALSGWPEPVYISNPGTKSRPTTPLPPLSGHTHEFHDGIPPAQSFGPSGSRSDGLTYAGNGNTPGKKAVPPSIASGNVPDESIFSKSCMYNIKPDQKCPLPDHPNHATKHNFPTPAVISSLIPTGTNTNDEGKQESHSLNGHGLGQPLHPKPEFPFPTSSTRGTPHPSPPSSTLSSPTSAPKIKPNLNHNHHHNQNYHPDPRRSTFRDPRLAPHVAVLSNRGALPITPNWTYSAHPHSGTMTAFPPPAMGVPTGVGFRVQAGQRGTGILVMRSTPDVYPLPQAAYPAVTTPAPASVQSSSGVGIGGMAGMATSMIKTGSGGDNTNNVGSSSGGRVGVATEVYPRDPDSALLWGSDATTPRGSIVGDMNAMPNGVSSDEDVKMEE